jgi:hypothetical protein
MMGWVVRLYSVASRRVVVHSVLFGAGSNSMMSTARWCPCVNGGGVAWVLCYGWSLLEAVLLYGQVDVSWLEGGGLRYPVSSQFSLASRYPIFSGVGLRFASSSWLNMACVRES